MISLGLTGVGAGRSADLPEGVTRALSETSVWCSHGALRTANLRSPALDPSSAFNLPRYEEIGIDAWVVAKRQSYQHAIESIQRRRADLVSSADLPIPTTAQAQADGELLLYEAMETVSDGAAASSSRGFFDIEDAPPWDTWFWYARSTIFSWVPNALVRDVQAGIDANPVDCIHWADWSRLPALL